MKINPRQMERAMRRMGMKMDQIDAEEVIIKSADKEIVISNPQVTKVNVGGQDTFQIVGDVSEREPESPENESNEDDVRVVMDRTGASEDEARNALEESEGDLAQAIIKLKTEKKG